MNKLLAFVAIFISLVLLISMSSEAKKTIKECKGGREFWGCESATKECQRLCENKHLSGKSKSCNKACHLSCVCVPGFLREGEDGDCVPEAECPNA